MLGYADGPEFPDTPAFEWLLLATHEGAARVRAEPFDAVELDLTSLWGEGEQGDRLETNMNHRADA